MYHIYDINDASAYPRISHRQVCFGTGHTRAVRGCLTRRGQRQPVKRSRRRKGHAGAAGREQQAGFRQAAESAQGSQSSETALSIECANRAPKHQIQSGRDTQTRRRRGRFATSFIQCEKCFSGGNIPPIGTRHRWLTTALYHSPSGFSRTRLNRRSSPCRRGNDRYSARRTCRRTVCVLHA